MDLKNQYAMRAEGDKQIQKFLDADIQDTTSGSKVDKECVIQYLDEHPRGTIEGFKKWLKKGMRY